MTITEVQAGDQPGAPAEAILVHDSRLVDGVRAAAARWDVPHHAAHHRLLSTAVSVEPLTDGHRDLHRTVDAALAGHSCLTMALVTPVDELIEPADRPPVWAAHLTGWTDMEIDGMPPGALPDDDPAHDVCEPLSTGPTPAAALAALMVLLRRITWGQVVRADGSTFTVAYSLIADELMVTTPGGAAGQTDGHK